MLGAAAAEVVALLARLACCACWFRARPPRARTDDDPRLARLSTAAALAEVDGGDAGFRPPCTSPSLLRRAAAPRVGETSRRSPHPAPSEALDAFLRPIGMRFRMAKRDTARVRAMLLALRRIRSRARRAEARRRRHRGGIADFGAARVLPDALLLMRIAAVAEKRDLGAILEWEERAASSPTTRTTRVRILAATPLRPTRAHARAAAGSGERRVNDAAAAPLHPRRAVAAAAQPRRKAAPDRRARTTPSPDETASRCDRG